MKAAAPWLLLALGLLQMAADLAGLGGLKAVAAASGASPAPKVFSISAGLETYSTRFFLEWTDRSGTAHSLEMTPELYAGLRGPYNRRNVYGAATAYGPVLASNAHTEAMFRSVFRYAVTGEAPLLRELGVDPASVDGPVRVRFEPLPGTSMGDLPRVLEVEAPR